MPGTHAHETAAVRVDALEDHEQTGRCPGEMLPLHIAISQHHLERAVMEAKPHWCR
jgi:hypothetical protein